MKLSKLSGWYRLWVAVSIIWVIFMLLFVAPFSPFPPKFVMSVALYRHWGRWGDFFLLGILPVVIPWSTVWVIQGFKNDRNKASGP